MNVHSRIGLFWVVFLSPGALIALLTGFHFPANTDVTPDFSSQAQAQAFYDKAYASPEMKSAIVSVEKSYDIPNDPTDKQMLEEIKKFVASYRLEDKRVLDVGAGAGYLQDVVADYTGLDISATARRYFHKPYVQGSATGIPFKDNEFDAIWTINVLEHVPNPELALKEMRRVLKPGGILYLYPAWYCRSWAADGYAVRPFSDFGVRGKLIKASIPVRDSRLYRALYTFPIRLLRLSYFTLSRSPTAFRYNKLAPNYHYYWVSDGDAVNSMDPYEAILWFTSRGDECLNNPTLIRQFFVRQGPVIIKVSKSENP